MDKTIIGHYAHFRCDDCTWGFIVEAPGNDDPAPKNGCEKCHSENYYIHGFGPLYEAGGGECPMSCGEPRPWG